MIKQIYTTQRFKKKLGYYSREERIGIQEDLLFFMEKPEDPTFKVHSLREKYAGYFSLCLQSNLRIMFKFKNSEMTQIILYDLGGHEIYK
jgi:mRNA-degrading endonuclease YafQ of YafQ-DinJ toxin-antitoxin module